MEKLFRTGYVPQIKEHQQLPPEEECIELDNRAFDIKDGDSKMLDYLSFQGTIAKSSLAASGAIKLCPDSFNCYKRDYGAVANPIRANKPIPPEIPQEIDEDKLEDNWENKWDNIFLNHKPDDSYSFAT